MRHLVRALGGCLFSGTVMASTCGLTVDRCCAQKTVAGTVLRSPTKPILFEVASIRPSREDEPFDQQFLPDGFLLSGGSVLRLIWIAYCPAGLLGVGANHLQNIPDWVQKDKVNILAKISPEDASEWQREMTSSWDSPAFKNALRALLADRYKLQAHTVPIEENGYALIRNKPIEKTKLTPVFERQFQDLSRRSQVDSESLAILPDGIIQFHNKRLSELALWLGPFSGAIVEDRTGLTERYDFSIRDRQPVHPTDDESEDYKMPTQRWDMSSLGLKLVRAKIHTTALFIDHIERPSPN